MLVNGINQPCWDFLCYINVFACQIVKKIILIINITYMITHAKIKELEFGRLCNKQWRNVTC